MRKLETKEAYFLLFVVVIGFLIYLSNSIFEFDKTIEKQQQVKVEPPKKDSGCISGDCIDGQGFFIYSNGDKYTGGFSGRLEEGQGTMIYANGDKYIGGFIAANKEGQGTLIYASGDKYTGSFVGGEFEGQGTLIFTTGDKYTGGFIAGIYEGQGVYDYANGNKYIGNFVANKKEGKGTFIFTTGEKYIGNFVAGKYDGEGTFIFANGTQQVGQWKEDKYLGNEQERLINQANAEAQRQRQIAEQAQRDLAYKNSYEARKAEQGKRNLEVIGKIAGGLMDMHQKGNQCRSQCEGYSDEIDTDGGFWGRPSSPRSRCLADC
jgi:hypothetical protein